MRFARRCAAALLLLAPATAHAQSPALAVWSHGTWQRWWRADSAPARWTGPLALVVQAIDWRNAAPGVDWGELRLSGSGEAWRVRAVVVRIDPRRVRLRVVEATSATHGARWTVDSAPPSAIVALNAGQFVEGSPWGWVASGGRERFSPEEGPLSLAFGVDADGGTHWLDPADLPRRRRLAITDAIQSYPTLLRHGVVPDALRDRESGVDLDHRDARLALGQAADGELLVVLTRFDALGESLGAVPFGITTPELAALMGALGCDDAVALDGGISAQLLVREATGGAPVIHQWRGLRKVPVGIIVVPR